jgi:hypothetical protein
MNIKSSPFDKAPENVKETKAFQRAKYFYEQRMYPNNFIPEDAYEKAYQQKEALKNSNGYAMSSPYDTWTNIGPTTGFLSSWANISSRISTVQYDPNNGNIIYLGAANGGIWKSTDGGTTWIPKSDFENSLSSGSIAIDPANSNIIYFGTGESTFSVVSYYGRGLLKSTNGGDTWTNLTSGLPISNSSYTSRIVIRPNNSSHLFAAMSYDGLYRSTNSGTTWTQVVSGRCDDIVFSPSGDSAYIAGSGTGYRVSVNGGASFTVNGSLPLAAERNHIAICKTNPNILYASTYDGGSTIKVYKSVDHGLTFSQVAIGQNFSGSQAWYDFYMYVNPFDANYAYVGSIDIWRTTNGGSTNFTNVSNAYGGGNVHPDQQNMTFHPTDPNQMLCVHDGGIMKSTNKGLSWINMNTNQTLTQFYRIASDPSNGNHILGGTQDNGTQRTLGSLNWTAAFGGDGGEVCFHSQNNAYILGETQRNGVQRSTNGGASWSSATSGLTGTGAWVGPILSHPTTSGIFYTARTTVFRSTNWGASWSPISSGTSGTIREMAISRTDPNVMYASVWGTMYRSLNAGTTYANVTTGLPGGTITSIYVHPDSSQVAFATVSGFGTGHIYKTTNTGASWVNISGNLPDSPANDAFIFNQGSGSYLYYAATDIGVFVTSNYGSTWTELAGGLPNTVAMHLDYNASVNKLRIGTHGRGVWEITPQPLVAAAPCEDFTSLTFPPAALNVAFTGTNYWSRNSVSAYGSGSGSAKFDFYSAVQGTVQSLYSNDFSPAAANTYLTFDEAYAPYTDSNFGPDTLLVEASSNSGSTYTTLATLTGRADGTGELNTAPPNVNAYSPANSEWRPKIYELPAGTNNIRLRAKSGNGNNLYLDNICVQTLPAPNVNNFIGGTPQGFYRGTPDVYSGIPDTIRVYLHRVDFPNVIVDSVKTLIDAFTSMNPTYSRALTGTYYVAVKHRNSIETWSASGQAFTRGNIFNFDFINQGAAYNNNQFQVNVPNNFWGFFGGDIDQNGFVDLSDVTAVNNDANLFASGYVVSDVTGNNATDLSDVLLTYNNNANFVQKQTPPGAAPLPSPEININRKPVFENDAHRQKYEAGIMYQSNQPKKDLQNVPNWSPMPSQEYLNKLNEARKIESKNVNNKNDRSNQR